MSGNTDNNPILEAKDINITINASDMVPLSLYSILESKLITKANEAKRLEIKCGELLVEVSALKVQIRILQLQSKEISNHG